MGMRKGPNGFTIEQNTRYLDHEGGSVVKSLRMPLTTRLLLRLCHQHHTSPPNTTSLVESARAQSWLVTQMGLRTKWFWARPTISVATTTLSSQTLITCTISPWCASFGIVIFAIGLRRMTI